MRCHCSKPRTATSRSTVPKGSVVLVALPRSTEVIVSSSGGGTSTIALGLILGLALGVLLAVAWDRTDRRVDSSDQLGFILGTPGARTAQLTPARALALVEAGTGEKEHQRAHRAARLGRKVAEARVPRVPRVARSRTGKLW